MVVDDEDGKDPGGFWTQCVGVESLVDFVIADGQMLHPNRGHSNHSERSIIMSSMPSLEG